MESISMKYDQYHFLNLFLLRFWDSSSYEVFSALPSLPILEKISLASQNNSSSAMSRLYCSLGIIEKEPSK